jgi:hypothetical protein
MSVNAQAKEIALRIADTSLLVGGITYSLFGELWCIRSNERALNPTT